GDRADGAGRPEDPEILRVLLLDFAAGPVTLDEQVSAAVREIAQVPEDGAEPGATDSKGGGDARAPGALRSSGRTTLLPERVDRAASGGALPLPYPRTTNDSLATADLEAEVRPSRGPGSAAQRHDAVDDAPGDPADPAHEADRP